MPALTLIASHLERLAANDAQTEADEHHTRVGTLTRDELWQLGQQATSPDDDVLDLSPQRGETFEEWVKRVDWQP